MPFRKLVLAVVLPLYLLDQATKWWTVARFRPPSPAPGNFVTPDPPIVVIEDFFRLTRVHNQGVAFGFGNGTTWAPLVFLLVPLVALALIFWYWKKGGFQGFLGKGAVALLLAGVLGNLTDRLVQGFLLPAYAEAPFWTRLSQGYVVDFLDFRIPFYEKIVPSSGGHWPVFNVADSCICVAAAFLFLSAFRAGEKEDRP